jgi:uncharacterized repeat protein (TIGR01451 family)
MAASLILRLVGQWAGMAAQAAAGAASTWSPIPMSCARFYSRATRQAQAGAAARAAMPCIPRLTKAAAPVRADWAGRAAPAAVCMPLTSISFKGLPFSTTGPVRVGRAATAAWGDPSHGLDAGDGGPGGTGGEAGGLMVVWDARLAGGVFVHNRSGAGGAGGLAGLQGVNSQPGSNGSGGLAGSFSARGSPDLDLTLNRLIVTDSGPAGDCRIDFGANVMGGKNRMDAGCSGVPENLGPVSGLAGALADNGGPFLPGGRRLRTFALLPGSNAIDQGGPLTTDDRCSQVDQRGVQVALDGDGSGACDIGAYEYAPAILVATTADEFDAGVTTTGCSLREAVQAVTTNAPFGGCSAGEIVREVRIPAGTYTLGSELSMTGDAPYVLRGAAPGQVIVQAAATPNTAAHRVLRIYDYRANLDLVNLVIQNGVTANYGGGLLFEGSRLRMVNVAFRGNAAGLGGGGLYFQGGVNVLSRANNVLFAGNYATVFGGGAALSTLGRLDFYNSTFSGNVAGALGGGLHSFTTDSAWLVRNTALWNNRDRNGQLATSQMYVDTDIAAVKLPQVAYSLIQNSGGSAAWNGAFLGLDLGNNLDRDPLFLAPLDPAGAPALGGDLRSAYPAGSLSDSGGSAYHWADELDIDGDGNTSEPTPYDLRGLNRASLTIDIGAYEGGQILFVDQAVSGGAQDGVSWANAFPELAQALAHVQAGGEAQQIWVAAGIYHPEEGSDDGRAGSFALPSNLAIYGGFSGSETRLAQRDPLVNLTILSGERGDPADPLDNFYHVVTLYYVDNLTLDGFTIQDGSATRAGAATLDDYGGGIFMIDGRVKLANLIVQGNRACIGGGLVSGLGDSQLDAVNLTVRNNQALTTGNCTSPQGYGGGLYLEKTDARLTNAVISGNYAARSTGALTVRNLSRLTLVNSTVSANHAPNGIAAIAIDLGQSARLENSIVWGNSPARQIATDSPITYTHSLVQGSGGSGAGWNAALGADGGGNLDADPRFALALDPLAAPSAGGDFSLSADSPAIGAAAAALLPTDIADLDKDGDTAEPLPLDRALNARLSGPAPELGAYEFVLSGSGPGGVDLVDGSGGLQLWLKAGAGLNTTGPLINTWADSSGAGHDAAQALGSPARPEFVAAALNGQGVARFDGVDDWLKVDGDAVFDTLALSTLLVGRQDRSGGEQFFQFGYNSGAGSESGDLYGLVGNSFFVNDTFDLAYLRSAAGTRAFEFGAPNNSSQIHALLAQNSLMEYLVSGNGAINSVGSDAVPAGHTGIWLGRRSDGGEPLSGDIAELLVFARQLLPVEAVLVHNYLSAKFAIPLPETYAANTIVNRYDGDTPANGDYDWDVAGVGQEGGQNLTALSAGLSVQADAATLDEFDYLLAGHRTAVNAWTSANLPAGVSGRWGRVWYLDKTGGLDASLGFDFSSAGIGAMPPGGNFVLLYAPTAALDFAPLNLTPALGASQVRFSLSDAQLADGYYTLACTSQTLTVTTLNDSGPGSLRQALGRVCYGDTIRFAPNLAGGVIRLQSPLTLRGAVTVEAEDAPGLTIRPAAGQPGFETPEGESATLAHLTITGASGANAVANSGALTVQYSLLHGNQNSGNGATIHSTSVLTVLHSTLYNNQVAEGAAVVSLGGGAIRYTTFVSNTLNTGDGRSLATIASAFDLSNSLVESCSAVSGLSGSNNLSSPGAAGSGCPGVDGPVTGLALLLANNGGPTRSLNLASASNAVDRVACSPQDPADQRGYARPFNHTLCDLGALEYTPPDPADLRLSKIAAPTTPRSGEALQYILSFANHGPATAAGVTISDTLPAEVSFVGFSASLDSGVVITLTGAAPDLVWQVSPLAPGQGGVINVQVTVNPLRYRTPIHNRAGIAYGSESDASNNHATSSLSVACPAVVPARLYVNQSGAGAGGGSWGDALARLQDALLLGRECGGVSEIWVAQGTYFPDQGVGLLPGDRALSFRLPAGAAVYGGFDGAESTLAERDWQAQPTVLSGAIGGTGVGDNSYHVVYLDSGAGRRLDGFVIRAGNADGSGEAGRGGGIYNSGTPSLANLTIEDNIAVLGGGLYSHGGSGGQLDNVHLSRNRATDQGGGIYSSSADLTLNGVTVSENTAVAGGGMYNLSSTPVLSATAFITNSAGYGGGMYNSANSNPQLVAVTFRANQASYGGGMFNNGNSNPQLRRATFAANQASYGGGMYNALDSNPLLAGVSFLGNQADDSGGGLYNDASSPQLVNVAFSGNAASMHGGALYNRYSSPTLTNVSVSGNRADSDSDTSGRGGALYNESSSPLLQNSILWDNAEGTTTHGAGASLYNDALSSPIVRSSLVQNCLPFGAWAGACGTDGGANLAEADPLFETPVDPVAAPTTAGDLRLQAASPAIDQGDNGADLDGSGGGAATIGDIATDLGGAPRIVNTMVDLGAFEFQLEDVALVKQAAFFALAPGGAITYTLIYANAGHVAATGIVIGDRIPVSVTVTGVTSSTFGAGAFITQTGGSPDFAWEVGDLAAGAGGFITLTGVMAADALPGLVITNTATITSSGDSNAANNSSSAAVTVARLDVFPARPGVAPGGGVTISATVTPPQAGLAVNFTIASGGGGLSSPSAQTDANGVAAVLYTAGTLPEVVRIKGGLAAAPDVRGRGILYVAAETTAGAIATSASGVYTVGDLSPHFIRVMKTGAGTPPLGWAEFGGNPCPAAAPGSRIVSPYVDVMVDDTAGVDAIVVTLQYTDTQHAAQHKLYWCNLGVWQQVTETVSIDPVKQTLVFTVTGATTPALFQLTGTPFVGAGFVPNAATVGDFVATGQADRVQITWQTLNEIGLYGFHLHRGLDPAGPGDRITGDPLPAQGAGGLEGFAYNYDDFTPRPAETPVYYWLEELHSDGTYRHGPLRVGGAGSLRIFLPAISRGGAAEATAATTPAPETAPAAEGDPTPTPEPGAAPEAGELTPGVYLPLITQ